MPEPENLSLESTVSFMLSSVIHLEVPSRIYAQNELYFVGTVLGCCLADYDYFL